jgi:hypothetical protein
MYDSDTWSGTLLIQDTQCTCSLFLSLMFDAFALISLDAAVVVASFGGL